jgi:hypothetical protein
MEENKANNPMPENSDTNEENKNENNNNNNIIEQENKIEDLNKEEKSINNENNNNNIEMKREITKEIIDIISKDKYKKYKGKNENELIKLKIEGLDNFSENKTLLEAADILKTKIIIFKNISTNNFNDLLTTNSYIAEQFKKYSLPEDLKNQLSEKEKQHMEEIEKDDKINLEEINFKNCEMDINFSGVFPTIKICKLINCQLPFNLHNKLNFNFLTHLILENVGLINENFEHLFFQIRANILLRKNLKILSVKNNNIGIIDLCKGIPDNQITSKAEFPNLTIMDFSNNKIFFISNKIINAIKNIKLIDLTNNNISFPFGYNSLIEAGKKNGFLVLITKNYGLMRENCRQDYTNYLSEIIPKFEYPIRNLALINLYVGNNYNKIKELNLSKFNNSLIELDISYGNINNNDLISLLNKNLALYNLKKLNIAKNKLTEVLLDLLLENNFHNNFNKLKELNLSGNPIIFKKAINFQYFFEKCKSIKLLIIKNTHFEECINNYMKNKINRYYENERFKKYKTNFTNEDLEIQKIIDNNHYLSEKTNIKINIFDINNNKYVSKIKKFYPEILDKIDIETRFFDK